MAPPPQVAAAQARSARLQQEAAEARAKAEAEAATLRAKRRRAREAAAAAAGGAGGSGDVASGTGPQGPGSPGATGVQQLSPGASPSASFTALGTGPQAGPSAPGSPGVSQGAEAAAPVPEVPTPKYGGLAGVLVSGCGAAYLCVANPDVEGGVPGDLEGQRALRLPEVEAAVRAAVGAPHNFEVGGLQG